MEKKDVIKIAEEKWPELRALKALENFYEYEKRFEELWLELGRKVLEASISEPSKDHRIKKK
ncbi:MAG: hypothetical protein GY810_28265 [Aureispira sp.]|nr:hypothetical protein [Aureispira sp.]